MKETVKTSRTAGYLEKIFRALNERYFDGVLEEPVITLTDTPKAYGHVTVSKTWALANGEHRHELNIGAGTLDRDITEVVATLLHEAVHLLHLQEGVQDTSRGGGHRDSSQALKLHKKGSVSLLWAERPRYPPCFYHMRYLPNSHG